MHDDLIGRTLSEIGSIVSNALDKRAHRLLLYAKLAENMVSAAIFTEEGNNLLFHWPPDDLTYPLLDLWEQTPAERWAEIEYILEHGKFQANFVYPEEIDQNEDHFERRDRIVRRYLGDKPIVYPPWKEDGDTFKL